MPQAKNRELIAVSSQAHEHLMRIVAAMKGNGFPTSGTMIASELILSMPIPQPVVEKKQLQKRGSHVTSTAAV